LRYPVIGEVSMKPSELRDEESGLKEEDMVKIEEITKQIPPPPILILTGQ
jgi:hypothetical protein